MDQAYFTLAIIAAIGVAYGLFRRRRSFRKGRGGWIGLGVLAVFFVGLVVAGEAGNESLTWFFGLALMAALPVMLFLAIGSAIGRTLGQDKASRSRDKNE